MKKLLAQVLSGCPLSTDQAVSAFEHIMSGQATPAQIGAMLAMIQQREPTTEEITGAAMVMRAKARKVSVPSGLTSIDTCGTGGDGAHTFNVSTAAALVAAAAGRPRGVVVVKHGNRSVTSQSGSSQVLESLGVRIEVDIQTLTRCLDDVGICFCFAPAHPPAMKHALPVRLELGFRTLFNVLGPLTNPAGARRQVVGVYSRDLTAKLAGVLKNLGSDHAMVVHGATPDGRGLDELSTCGPTWVAEVRDGAIREHDLDPMTLNLDIADVTELKVDGPEASSAVIRSVFRGQRGAPRDFVLLNAAAALVVADLAENLAQGLELASDAVDSGAANRTLNRLIEVTQA